MRLPSKKTKKTAMAQGDSSKNKKENQRAKDIPPTGNAKVKTPTSVGSDMKFLPNERLEKYSQDTVKKLASQPCAGYEIKEREAREMVEANFNLMRMKVCNGMWPFLSDVSLSEDGNIPFYRIQINHNAISSNLTNEITNNYLRNPMRADFKGKVHAKDMESNMTCFLTYNNKVSVKTILKNFYNL